MCLPSVLNRANKYPHVKHSDHTKTRQSLIQCTIMLTDLAAFVLIKPQGRRTLITKHKPAAAM